jgi:hypothetical protein
MTHFAAQSKNGYVYIDVADEGAEGLHISITGGVGVQLSQDDAHRHAEYLYRTGYGTVEPYDLPMATFTALPAQNMDAFLEPLYDTPADIAMLAGQLAVMERRVKRLESEVLE